MSHSCSSNQYYTGVNQAQNNTISVSLDTKTNTIPNFNTISTICNASNNTSSPASNYINSANINFSNKNISVDETETFVFDTSASENSLTHCSSKMQIEHALNNQQNDNSQLKNIESLDRNDSISDMGFVDLEMRSLSSTNLNNNSTLSPNPSPIVSQDSQPMSESQSQHPRHFNNTKRKSSRPPGSNDRERQRRSDLNSNFKVLESLLQLNSRTRIEKVTILAGAIERIKQLKLENENLNRDKCIIRSEMKNLIRCLQQAFSANAGGGSVSTQTHFDPTNLLQAQAQAAMSNSSVNGAIAPTSFHHNIDDNGGCGSSIPLSMGFNSTPNLNQPCLQVLSNPNPTHSLNTMSGPLIDPSAALFMYNSNSKSPNPVQGQAQGHQNVQQHSTQSTIPLNFQHHQLQQLQLSNQLPGLQRAQLTSQTSKQKQSVETKSLSSSVFSASSPSISLLNLNSTSISKNET